MSFTNDDHDILFETIFDLMFGLVAFIVLL